MNYIFKKSNLIYLLFFLILSVGLSISKDFGIGIEEHFQRKSGFYWLNYILSFTNFNSLKFEVLEKIYEINLFTPNLPPIEKFSYYGVIFDLPLAFTEAILKIDEPQNYFLLRHNAIFFIFLCSAFCFYKIILGRFNNLNLANFGFLIYVFSPRIFGNIFFDNKDILFLSIITFNFYFFYKYLKNNCLKNLFFLSIFCALSTSTRIIGLLLPLSFFLTIFLKGMSENKLIKNLKIIIFFIFFYLIFLFLHWPYLWTLSFEQWTNFFSPFFQAMNPTVFFNGEYYQSKYLPISYLPLWIILTTPFHITVLSCIGFFFMTKRFYKRYIRIESNTKKICYDLWSSRKENFDLVIFFNFLLVILLYFSVNLALLSGWRHFYFLNFFLIYFTCFSVYLILNKLRNSKRKIIFLSSFLSFFILIQIFDIYKYHPFQSSYFNNLISKSTKENFEIDTQSLSRVHALKEILKEQMNYIVLGTASWTPLENARSLIPKKMWSKLNFVGTNFENADFIYSNHYYEVDINYNKKYQIPKNFSLYKTFSIDDTKIYSIYKKN
jgi:hypothetical protein